MNYVRLFDDVKDGDIEVAGGKGLSLGRMIQAGFPVPAGFIITTDAYKTFSDSEISPELEEEIFKYFDALGVARVAVRSSAIAEDSQDASWAGQFESYLNVDCEHIVESIKKCWQSASSEVVESYAKSRSTSKERLAIAVVVQKMVDSDISGVAFSVNPVTKNNDEIMVEAIYGLGELLVQGMITPDNFVISKTDFDVLEKNIKTKPVMLTYQDSQNVEIPVPDEKQNQSCLTDSQLVELAGLIVKIEQFYGKPQDVEWAIENGSFYIVQSRPITTI
jgi:phosphoenolpyruvate synthase/pyruvate phosphate dikinase